MTQLNNVLYKFKFPLIYLFWCIPFSFYGQRIISGHITDAEDKKPIPGANVFISNTTVGTTTDDEGFYQLRIPGEGSYQLTASYVGYHPVLKSIEPGNINVIFDIAFDTIELEEVTVVTKVRFRKTDINLFWNTILGKNPSKRTIHATNPEAVYYYFNSDSRILKVTCREPLQIVNYETGYQIQYVLNHFTHDYNTGITDWSYQDNYNELKPENSRQQNNWKKKRQEVYKVSLTNLFKSLYDGTYIDNGFVLADFIMNPEASNAFRLFILHQDSIVSSVAADNSKALNLSDHQILLFCLGRPVKEKDLNMIQRMQGNDLLQNRRFFINLLNGNEIRIYPDGTYTNNLQVTPMNLSTKLSGHNMKLPLEYLPDSSNPLITKDKVTETVTNIETINQYLEQQRSIFPQEKIHLHTDRDMYVSGEKIWFKAYLTDALTHQYPTKSRYVYVELISQVDTVISRVMVRPINGLFFGNLSLPQNMLSANYTLRAYTRYMENLGDDYFFKKNIRIVNLSSQINQSQSTENTEIQKDDFLISFFPEGGNLPEGVLSKVAFKALNINGSSEMVSGMLIDENGFVISAVNTLHDGMGVFEYIPEAGKKIFLKCKNTNSLERQFELPQPISRAYSLSVFPSDDNLLVKINHSVKDPDLPCFLLAHCRGEVLFFSEWNTEKDSVIFNTEEFPAGIIHFILFDEEMNTLSERLMFNKNYDENVGNIEFQTDKSFYKMREKVVATLSFSDMTPSSGNEREPFISLTPSKRVSHFSVAITDDKDNAVDSMTTILSTLLLTSELKGYIENPAWYLQDNAESITALDYLMMTHGWRRYIIPDVIKGNLQSPQIPFQTSQEITGYVKSMTFSRSVNESEVTMLSHDGDFGITSTDEKGIFRFDGFEFPDSTSFFIQALNKSGSNRVKLVLDSVLFPSPVHAPQNVTKVMMKSEEDKPISSHLFPLSFGEGWGEANSFMVKAEQRSKYDESMRVIYLDEVEVTAPRIERRDEPRLQYWANTSSDLTIRSDDFQKNNPLTVTELLNNIAGISISNNGEISIRGGSLPLVLIDGVLEEWPEIIRTKFDSPLERVSVHEVESIDVFKGPGTAIFGSRGYSGVISVTTKKTVTLNRNEREDFNYTVYTPLGFQKPVEFYSPQYETLESKYMTIPDFRTTIFWKPDIIITESEEASFEFYTSDDQTTYLIVIEGITSDGKIIRKVGKILVQ